MKQHHLVFSVTRDHWKWKDIERRIKIHPEMARFNHQPVLKEFSDLQLEIPTWERTQILNLLEKKHTGMIKNYYTDFADSPFAEEFTSLLNDSFEAEAERYGYHSNWYSTFDGLIPTCYMMTKDDDHVPELELPILPRQDKTSAPSTNSINNEEDNKQVDQSERKASEHRYQLALQRVTNQQTQIVEDEDDDEKTQLEKKMNDAKIRPSTQPPIMPDPQLPLVPQLTKKRKHKHKDHERESGD